MNIPDTVNICGSTYEVKSNPKSFESEGCTYEQVITLGIKCSGPEKVFCRFIHETIELCLVERYFKYDSNNNGSLFIMTHGELSTFCSDLAAALYPTIEKASKAKTA